MAFAAHDWMLAGVLAYEDDDELDTRPANQLALQPPVQDAPLIQPTAPSTGGALVKGSTRKKACGLCRSCLFSPSHDQCLATRSRAQLVAFGAQQLACGEKRTRVRRLERRLAKAGRAAASAGPPSESRRSECGLCKREGHRALGCPLNRFLTADPPGRAMTVKMARSVTSDEALRRVLLNGAASLP